MSVKDYLYLNCQVNNCVKLCLHTWTHIWMDMCTHSLTKNANRQTHKQTHTHCLCCTQFYSAAPVIHVLQWLSGPRKLPKQINGGGVNTACKCLDGGCHLMDITGSLSNRKYSSHYLRCSKHVYEGTIVPVSECVQTCCHVHDYTTVQGWSNNLLQL